MAEFRPGEQRWIERLGNLRNTIRQEVIARQLADHVRPGMTVLDVGCGQGTQAMRLAALGCHITGLDQSTGLLARFAGAATDANVTAELITGRIEDLDDLLGARAFDLVCAHGLLMYLDERAAAIAALAQRVAPGGRLSITVRNGHALAMRPARRRDWSAALAAFESREYVNELGILATADRLEDVQRDVTNAGLTVLDWYGVRVFNDAVPADMDVPTDESLADLLDAEDLAGRRDPYRWMASQLHIVAARAI